MKHSKHYSVCHMNNNLIPQNDENNKIAELMLLRKEFQKETDLILKLKKLMLDSCHPQLYDYKQWPKLKHVWGWVKKMTAFQKNSTGVGYIC